MVSLDFSVTYSFRPYHGPRIDSSTSENEYQEYFLGVKAAGAWGWPHHLNVLNVMEIWESKHLGTLWATSGLLRDSFTFTLIYVATSSGCSMTHQLVTLWDKRLLAYWVPPWNVSRWCDKLDRIHETFRRFYRLPFILDHECRGDVIAHAHRADKLWATVREVPRCRVGRNAGYHGKLYTLLVSFCSYWDSVSIRPGSFLSHPSQFFFINFATSNAKVCDPKCKRRYHSVDEAKWLYENTRFVYSSYTSLICLSFHRALPLLVFEQSVRLWNE
jgi:hypothetical protein